MSMYMKVLLGLCLLAVVLFGGWVLPELIRTFVSLTIKSAMYLEEAGI